jgi:AcrR family transcriptional regulator
MDYNIKPTSRYYIIGEIMQERSQATREQLLASAERCFSLSGYDATGVAEICTEAQVSKGAFYHHFPIIFSH